MTNCNINKTNTIMTCENVFEPERVIVKKDDIQSHDKLKGIIVLKNGNTIQYKVKPQTTI